MNTNSEIIQADPLAGFELLQKLIAQGELSDGNSSYPITKESRLEARVYHNKDRKKALLICKTPDELRSALTRHPFTGPTKKDTNSYVWEYRVFTPGEGEKGKGVNVWKALHRTQGFTVNRLS